MSIEYILVLFECTEMITTRINEILINFELNCRILLAYAVSDRFIEVPLETCEIFDKSKRGK